MVNDYLKIFKYILILVIAIFPTNNAVELRTRMSISGSLNHLCENDPNSSDELPSCKCLEQFSAQGNLLEGTYPDNLGTPVRLSVDSDDLIERTYKNVDKLVAAVGVNKVAGLKCIDNDGNATELSPVYSYTVYIDFSYGLNKFNGLLTVTDSPDPSLPKGSQQVSYIADMTEENAATIKTATVMINDTQSFEVENLGKICKNENKPKSFASFLWSVMNRIVTGASKTCDIPKGSNFPLGAVSLPTVITVTEPLECGAYTVYIDVSTNKSWALGFQLHWRFAYDRYCAYIES